MKNIYKVQWEVKSNPPGAVGSEFYERQEDAVEVSQDLRKYGKRLGVDFSYGPTVSEIKLSIKD